MDQWQTNTHTFRRRELVKTYNFWSIKQTNKMFFFDTLKQKHTEYTKIKRNREGFAPYSLEISFLLCNEPLNALSVTLLKVCMSILLPNKKVEVFLLINQFVTQKYKFHKWNCENFCTNNPKLTKSNVNEARKENIHKNIISLFRVISKNEGKS